MKRLGNIVIVMILLVTSIYFSSIVKVNATEGDDYAWVLVEIVDHDNKDKFEEHNTNNTSYNHEGNYDRNNFKIKWTYIGKTDTYYEPDMINGESITFNASYSKPPSLIQPGDEIIIDLSLSAGESSLSFFTPSGSARGQIGKNSSGWGDFANDEKKSSFKTYSKNSYASINETLTAIAPAGREGDKLELRFHLYCGQKLETRYIYQWNKTEDVSQELGEYTPSPEVDKKEDESVQDNSAKSYFPEAKDGWREGHIFEVPKTPEGEYIDSGVRFADAYGEVLIRRGDNPLEWEALEIDSPIYVGDIIKVSYDSQAKLSLPDMTIFTLGEETRVIMDTMSPEENKLALLAGKIIFNIKEMIKDGRHRPIEMSQAVAGIKGTTFVLEEDGTTSTLKVLEGTVEFTPYGKEAITVTSEETVSVTDGTPSRVEKFSISEELSTWDEATQDYIKEALLEKGIAIDNNDEVMSETVVDESSDQSDAVQGSNELNESEESLDLSEASSTDESTDYKSLFEEKIAEHEKHVQRRSFLKYLLAAVVVGAGVGIYLFIKKKS